MVASILMEHLILRHLCSRYLLSSIGLEFNNHVVDLLCEKMNVLRLCTSPYHPQSNGKLKKNSVLNEVIKKTLNSSNKDWEPAIPSCLLVNQTSVNESTRYTPFFLTTQRELVVPLDTLLASKHKYMGDEYVPTILSQMLETFIYAKHKI